VKYHCPVFLLVEDDANDRFLMQRELAGTGAELHCVRDGAEAVEYLKGEGEFANRENFPLPNLIVLDLKMPRMSGFDFLEWLRKSSDNCSSVPVVVMSSSDMPGDIHRAYKLGANGYMIKPIDVQEFKKRVHALGVLWTEHLRTPELTKSSPSES